MRRASGGTSGRFRGASSCRARQRRCKPQRQRQPRQRIVPCCAPAAPAAASTGGGGAFVKIVLIVVGVIFVFGAIGIAGVVYVGYRAKQKLREMGLTSEHIASPSIRRARRRRRRLQMSLERRCQRSDRHDRRSRRVHTRDPTSAAPTSLRVMSTELTMKHAMQLNKAASKEMSKEAQEQMENMGKTILGRTAGARRQQRASRRSRRDGVGCRRKCRAVPDEAESRNVERPRPDGHAECARRGR